MHNYFTHTTKQIIGKRIKTLRTKKKLTLQELADKIGADRQYVWNIENGEVNLTLDYLDKIINALNATQEEFMNINF
ncbi:MAG: helix-turn-helix transcriptional regulator [Bacteroidetes bacterium]|nr:helix-turn-helix transcriptional regulator [Bacteroidota bacterium]